MKNLIKGFAFLSMLSLFSCTKIVYTHEQVIGLYKTKQDVMKAFKIPTEKKMSDSTEEWLYRYDRNTSFTDHTIAEFPNTHTVDVTDFNRYKRYIIFTMDKQGNIIRCDYEGVDLAVRKKNPAGTIALIAGGLVIITMGYVGSQNISWSYSPIGN
ncbi:MAG: hypothetical protein ACHQHN_15275 [Sphingobacteriales bacterium]